MHTQKLSFFIMFCLINTPLTASLKIILPKEIKVNTRQPKLSEICTNINGVYYTISLKKSKILSSSDISKILSQRQSESYIFIGDKIHIEYLPSQSPDKAIKNILPPEFTVTTIPLHNPIHITKSHIYKKGNQAMLDLEGYEFPSTVGKKFHQIILLQTVSKPRIIKQPTPVFQLIRKNGETILIYQKKNLKISAPVKIVRTLDSGRFLVENKKSGVRKIITANLTGEF